MPVCSCKRRPLDRLWALTHSAPAQSHPEPVERMSLSNWRADVRSRIHSLALVATTQALFPRSPIRKTRFAGDGRKPWLRGSCERQPRPIRGPDPFDSAQGHPEPVERMSVSNGRADGRFQIHSPALVATNQMLFPRSCRSLLAGDPPYEIACKRAPTTRTRLFTESRARPWFAFMSRVQLSVNPSVAAYSCWSLIICLWKSG
jgi:hypothetical protein